MPDALSLIAAVAPPAAIALIPRKSGYMKTSIVSAAIAASLCHLTAHAAGSAPASTAAPGGTVEQLISSMTIEEKVDLIGGTGFATRAIPRLGIPAFKM